MILLAQLAAAATWHGLASREAVVLVLDAALTIYETTVWTRDGWRDRLAGLLPARPENVTLTADVNAVMPATPPAPDDAAYDYEARLHTLERVARAHGASDPDALDTTLATATALRDAGVHVRREDARGIAELLRVVRGVHADAEDRLRLLAALDGLHVRAADAERVLRAALVADEVLGLDADGVMLLAQELARLRFDPRQAAAWVAHVVARHGSLERELADHERVVGERKAQALELAKDVAWLEQRLRTLVAVVRRAEKDPTLKGALKIADAEGDKGALAQIVKLVEVRRKAPAGRQDASA